MDDFDKEFPDFDWKNTPAYKHPGGKDCPCPKHEYVREQVKFTKQVNETGKDARVTLKFCPEHYNVYMNEVIPAAKTVLVSPCTITVSGFSFVSIFDNFAIISLICS